MKNTVLLSILLFIHSTNAFAQQIFFGTNNFIEYQAGNLPIVISVPHGGYLNPKSIPDRTCNNPVYATDAFTIETAEEIKASLFQLTGCYPHIIICHLNRSKLDCNRNIADGACGNSESETAWNEFHSFIQTAQNSANNTFNNKTFFIDLHGHGNPIQRIELGYLLYDYELELSDLILNTSQYLKFSSIKNLALNNTNNYTHAQLLRGEKSLGTLLSNYGFSAVPGTQIPFPGTSTNYFSGGYIIANHTCYIQNNNTNGVQMELNYNGIRDTPTNRQIFARKFSSVILEYLNTHTDVALGQCSIETGTNIDQPSPLIIYPNPLKGSKRIFIKGSGFDNFSYVLADAAGRTVSKGMVLNGEIIFHEYTPQGFYILVLSNPQNKKPLFSKLVIE